MSFYNFKLNDSSSYSTSSAQNPKLNRFVHKTFTDYQAAASSAAAPTTATQIDSRIRGPLVAHTSRFRVQKPPAEKVLQDLRPVSITSTLAGITHTFSPVTVAGFRSGRSAGKTSIRVVKLFGDSPWHSHDDTDEVFVVLHGELSVLYKTHEASEEKMVRISGGEVLCVPMGMEHCLVAQEGTEVLLLEGSQEGD